MSKIIYIGDILNNTVPDKTLPQFVTSRLMRRNCIAQRIILQEPDDEPRLIRPPLQTFRKNSPI